MVLPCTGSWWSCPCFVSSLEKWDLFRILVLGFWCDRCRRHQWRRWGILICITWVVYPIDLLPSTPSAPMGKGTTLTMKTTTAKTRTVPSKMSLAYWRTLALLRENWLTPRQEQGELCRLQRWRRRTGFWKHSKKGYYNAI